MSTAYYEGPPLYCGSWVTLSNRQDPSYLPMIDVAVHATIRDTAQTTCLTQVFRNPESRTLEAVHYTFPIRDGVSIAHFKCTVAGVTYTGLVMRKQEARDTFNTAVASGQSAALLTQSWLSADVFTTELGNLPANESMTVEIAYVGELASDAQVGGARYTVPSIIMPRYGSMDILRLAKGIPPSQVAMKISVDIWLSKRSRIKRVTSPSHPIDVSIGVTSADKDGGEPAFNKASAQLSLQEPILDRDFVLQFAAEDFDRPAAWLETHPTLEDHRALMITGVPKCELQQTRPEIIFLCDRSGSMSGNIDTLRAALGVFVKSLPVGIKFNICSFGSRYELLWPTSQEYTEASMQKAEQYVGSFQANFGGTEMKLALEAVLARRASDIPTEIIVLTDGAIWDQQALFNVINNTRKLSPVRCFGIGIGDSVSISLVEGIARSGAGFAEFTANNEAFDAKLVKLLKGALSPQIHEPVMSVFYDDDEYDIVHHNLDESPGDRGQQDALSQPPPLPTRSRLPNVQPPSPYQTPAELPALFPFARFTAYILLPAGARQRQPSKILLRATTKQGPISLDIDVQSAGIGDTIHKLAARKAMQEAEEGRGWLYEVPLPSCRHKPACSEFPNLIQSLVERECVRLGVKFQVVGKHCSFVAVPGLEKEIDEKIARLTAKVEDYHIEGDAEKGEDDFESIHMHEDQILWATVRAAQEPNAPQANPFNTAGGYSSGSGLRSASRGGLFGATTSAIAPHSSNPFGQNAQAINAFAAPRQVEDVTPDAPVVRQMDERAFKMTGSKSLGDASPASSPGNKKESLFYSIVQSQGFNGSWILETLPTDQMAIDKNEFNDRVAALQGQMEGVPAAEALATACVLRFFQEKLAEFKERWELVWTKGRVWLESAVQNRLQLVMDEAARTVKQK